MKTQNKQKPPERSLIGAIILCFVCGLVMLAVPIALYSKRDGLKVSPDTSSVSIAKYNSVADLAHYFVFSFSPIIGFIFLVTGYLIWKGYRKIKLAKENQATSNK